MPVPEKRDSPEYFFLNSSKQVMLATSVAIADTFFTRLKGLLGTGELKDGKALYIVPCRSIHMFGMKYSIDALFIDKDLRVVGIVHAIEPGKMSNYFKEARACLELPAGTIEKTNTELGDLLEFGPTSQ